MSNTLLAPPALPKGQTLSAPGIATLTADQGPGVASRDEDYDGSRKTSQRYAYSDQSRAGMVELHPLYLLTEEEFKSRLASAPGVASVVYKATGKAEQGNVGDHFMERNLMVHLDCDFDPPLEFKLIRHHHMVPGPNCPYTIMAMFKDPP